MPQNKNPAQKKKKKGHAPAHQNKFAYKHNPKSKTTDKILSSPNVHVCRRCYEKIEWRKQYRKYKPLTQPSRCNGCQKRNVLAAYHTICESCTRASSKAKELIEEKLSSIGDDNDEGDKRKPQNLRACAMCVKEIALPASDDEEEDELEESMGRIRLRERKTMERKAMREANKTTSTTTTTTSMNTTNENDSESVEGSNNISFMGSNDADDDDEEDPFLKAVGGASQLLTGEAYQKKLLEQQQQKQQ